MSFIEESNILQKMQDEEKEIIKYLQNNSNANMSENVKKYVEKMKFLTPATIQEAIAQLFFLKMYFELVLKGLVKLSQRPLKNLPKESLPVLRK